MAGVSLLMPIACGQSEEEPPPPGNEIHTGGKGGAIGGGGGTTGAGGSKGGAGGSQTGGSGGEDPGDSLAPTVRITSPESLRHPDDGTVLTETEVEVFCEATQSPETGSEPVNRSKVVLRMLGAEGEELDNKPAAEAEPGVFFAPFFLQEVANGAVSFECTAEDEATPPHVGSDAISTFVDHGPTIEVSSPLENSSYSLLAPVPFSFTVTASPLVDDDPGSEVDLDSVSLTVLGKTIELDRRGEEYRATVNLADTDLFPDPPPTVPVLIAANNVREPMRGEALLAYNIKVDSTGPVIEITAPARADVVGGEVFLRFTVSDDGSGVDEQSVFVNFNGGDPIYFDERAGWARNGADFSYRFDTTAIVGSTAQVVINVEAKDGAGNDADGESLLLYLDNHAPIVDLDPPMVREYTATPTETTCSVAFDPVGPAAANDQARVGSLFTRALVSDRTNPAMFKHYAGVNRESVYLYLQIDPDRPVLVSTDADGECEDIDATLPFFRLIAIPPAGESYYGPANAEPSGAPPFPTGCVRGPGGTPPLSLCRPPSSDLTRVIPWDFDSTVPAIYGIPPLDDPACTGLDWEIGSTNGIEEGWVCVAARAVDNAGNVGVSAPLRICYDDGQGAPASCPDPAPSCTDGCTVSAVNRFPPNQVLLDP